MPIDWQPLLDLRRALGDSDDVSVRQFLIGNAQRAAVVSFDGLIDKNRLEETVLRPLINDNFGQELPDDPDALLQQIRQTLMYPAAVRIGQNLNEAVQAVLFGNTVLVLEGSQKFLVISNYGAETRKVTEPLLEVTVRGPRQSFTERLETNIALVRRLIRTPNLRMQIIQVGRVSKSRVVLAYIDGLAAPGVIAEAKQRLHQIDVDNLTTGGNLEQLIEDCWYSPFPQIDHTERPDVVAANLAEGCFALLVEHDPFVLIAPTTLNAMMHSPEDYYERWLPASILRFVRFVGSFIALMLPGLYVSFAAYHPGLLPTTFALKLSGSREGVALPVVFEAGVIQLLLELIKEAGFRMPSPIAQTFGIVGGLVLGEMGVKAGLVSEAMVIVVAVTAIASFAVPTFSLATLIRLLGFPLMMAAALFGLVGLMVAALIVLAHLSALKSFGVPYLMPYPYMPIANLKDTFVIAHSADMHQRPKFIGTLNRTRMKDRRPDGDTHVGGRNTQ